jgi:hypothetical protein
MVLVTSGGKMDSGVRWQLGDYRKDAAMSLTNRQALHGLVISLFVAGTLLAVPAYARADGRIPTSFRWYYQFEPKGWRIWTRQNNTTWVERYVSGQVDTFSDLGPGDVNGCKGLILLKDNNTLQVFVPDDQCASQVAFFQFIRPNGPKGPWNVMGEMQNVGY